VNLKNNYENGSIKKKKLKKEKDLMQIDFFTLLEKYRQKGNGGKKHLREELEKLKNNTIKIKDTSKTNKYPNNKYIVARDNSKAKSNKGERGLGWKIYKKYKFGGNSSINIENDCFYAYSFEVPMRGYWEYKNKTWIHRKKADLLFYNKTQNSLTIAELKGKYSERNKGSFILEGFLELIIYYLDSMKNKEQIRCECYKPYECKDLMLSRKQIEKANCLEISEKCFLIAPEEYWKKEKEKNKKTGDMDLLRALLKILETQVKIKIMLLSENNKHEIKIYK